MNKHSPADEITLHGMKVNAHPGQRPVHVDHCDTVVKLFAARCAELGPRTAHREKDYGIWQSYSWADYWTHAKWIGLGLVALGLKRGEVVSILSEDRKEWAYADMGVQCVGGIASGVYTTDSASQLEYLLRDSDSRFLFVEDDEQLDKFLEIADKAKQVTKVIILEDEGLHDLNNDRCIFIQDLYKLGQAYDAENPGYFEAEINKAQPGDTGLLIYTSGTTGMPKGAMLTQENIIAAMECGAHCLPVFPEDEQLCFLPLCHILERDVSIYFPLAAKSTVNFAESPETVFDNMQEVSPTVFTAVPRVWEKVYSRVLVLAQEATWIGRLAFGVAVKAGLKRADYLLEGKPVPAMVALNYAIWNTLVLKNLRVMLGMDRLRRGTTGAAPISPELLRWYWAIGVPLIEGYGMTENTGIATVNTPLKNRIGSIGHAYPGMQVRLGEAEEIQDRKSVV